MNPFFEEWLRQSSGLIPAVLSSHEKQSSNAESTSGHIGGLVAVGASYAAAGFFIAVDGPLPFGDAIAVGILAVPDAAWYGLGYWIAE